MAHANTDMEEWELEYAESEDYDNLTYAERTELEGEQTGTSNQKTAHVFNLIVTSDGTVELYSDALSIGMYTDSSTYNTFGNTTFYCKSTVVAVGSDSSGPWFKLRVGKLKVDHNC